MLRLSFSYSMHFNLRHFSTALSSTAKTWGVPKPYHGEQNYYRMTGFVMQIYAR